MVISIISTFISSVSPTQPRSISSPSTFCFRFFFATINLPSLPDKPIPLPPCFPMSDTMRSFTLPTSTILTISSVSSSVIRSPPINFGFLPSFSIIRVISGPPPCTITGFIPTNLSRTMSCVILSMMLSSTNACPPTFITTFEP